MFETPETKNMLIKTLNVPNFCCFKKYQVNMVRNVKTARNTQFPLKLNNQRV